MEQSSSYNAYMISIHALLAESDAVTTVVVGPSSDFYPRSPCGERPAADLLAIDTGAFLSTLSLRRATKDQGRQPADPGISIHALLAESDATKSVPGANNRAISIHALLAESDKRAEIHASSQQEFLSTLSLRRATHYDNYNLHCVEISIHALLAESDCMTHTLRCCV